MSTGIAPPTAPSGWVPPSAQPPTGAAAPRPSGPVQRRQPTEVKPLVSLLGALSVLAGGAALLTTVSGGSWIGPTVQVVGLVWLIGLGCRLLRVAAPVTVLAQAAGVLVTLTAIFTVGGYGGIIPNARAAREAEVLLTGAWEQIMHSTVPAPATQELAFLIAVALGLIALIVDFFVSEVDAPALVALPLLCLYSVPASIAEDLLPWWSFALPAALYAALVALAGHPGRRVGLRAGVGVAVAGGLAIVLAIGSSLLVADSITEVGTAGRISRDNAPLAGGDVGLSTFAALKGSLVRSDPQEVLQISGIPGPDYLRTTALEKWDPASGFSIADPDLGATLVGSPITVQPLAVNPEAQQATVDVKVLGFADQFVPIYQGTSSAVGLDGSYSYNAELGSIFRDQASRPSNYRLDVAYGQISPDLLRADTVTQQPGLTADDGIPDTAVAEALRITAAGQTAFDKALLLKEYFTDPANNFKYSLQVPVGNSGSLLTDFLTNKQGYCEQYAAAMAIMLRSLGIPARVAIGFTQGTETAPQTYLITSHDAHAWVEVKFDRAGWVRFDPTPLSTSVAGQQGYATTDPATAASGTETSADSATAGSASAGSTQRATVTDFETVIAAGSGQSGDSLWKPWYTVTLVLLGVLAILVAMPSFWRRRRAAQRMAVAAGGGSAAADAAWAEIEDLARDHGLASGRATTVRKAANQLARDAKLTEAARAGLRRIALGTETAWYAPDGYLAAEGVNLAEDVRRIAVDLEHSSPRRLRTKLLPPSLVSRD